MEGGRAMKEGGGMGQVGVQPCAKRVAQWPSREGIKVVQQGGQVFQSWDLCATATAGASCVGAQLANGRTTGMSWQGRRGCGAVRASAERGARVRSGARS